MLMNTASTKRHCVTSVGAHRNRGKLADAYCKWMWKFIWGRRIKPRRNTDEANGSGELNKA